MKVNLKSVHQRIRERGWGQNQFARAAGLSPGFVSRVFNGKRNSNSMSFLAGCRRAFPDAEITEFLILEDAEETDHSLDGRGNRRCRSEKKIYGGGKEDEDA